MSQWLTQKRIAITGGTTGLGMLVAKAFVREGAPVIVVGRDAENAESQLDSRGIALQGDATDPATAPAAIDRCQTALCPKQHSY